VSGTLISKEIKSRGVWISTPDSVLDSVELIAPYLDTVDGGENPYDPIPLSLSEDFPSLFSNEDGWGKILGEIYKAKKYVGLDLSACTIGNDDGEFCPVKYVERNNEKGNNDSFITDYDNLYYDGGEEYIVYLVLPKEAELIRESFRRFTNLKSIGGKGVKKIENTSEPVVRGPFNESSIVNVDFPNVTDICVAAFHGSRQLETVNVEAAETIGKEAFFMADKLKTVNLPKAINIGQEAFVNSGALTTVKLLAVKKIGVGAFYRCSRLEEIWLPEAAPSLYGSFVELDDEDVEGMGLDIERITIVLPDIVKILDGKPTGNTSYNETWIKTFVGNSRNLKAANVKFINEGQAAWK
jgi:hypothetical protein